MKKTNAATLGLCLLLMLSFGTGCSRSPTVAPELEVEPPVTAEPLEEVAPREEGSADPCTEPTILWRIELPSTARVDGHRACDDGRIFLWVSNYDETTNNFLHYDLHEVNGLTGEVGVQSLERPRASQLNGIAYTEGSTAYVVGPQGPVPLPGYNFEAWPSPTRNITLTNLGYVVMKGVTGGTYLVHVDNTGQILWEQLFSDEGLRDHRGHSDGPEVYDQLQVIEEADTLLVYGKGVRGLHALSLSKGSELFTYSIPGADFITSVSRTPDGGYFVAGYTGGPGEVNTGVIARLSPTGVELDSHITHHFGLVVASAEEAPDTCWFTEGEPWAKTRLHRWQMGSDPVEMLDDVGFFTSNKPSLVTHEDMVLAAGRGTTLLHVVRPSGITQYCLAELDRYNLGGRYPSLTTSVILGVQNNTVIMLMSWRQPHTIIAIDLGK